MRPIILMLCAAMLPAGIAPAGMAYAQETAPDAGNPDKTGLNGADSPGNGMANLLREGYEIRAAAPNGARFVVFLQKNQSAYACEFVTLTNSRCGSIN